MDTTYTDNVEQKSKTIRRPDGHSFKVVQVLQRSFENEAILLIFDYNGGPHGPDNFVLKSNKWKAEALSNLNLDGNHRSGNENVLLNILHTM